MGEATRTEILKLSGDIETRNSNSLVPKMHWLYNGFILWALFYFDTRSLLTMSFLYLALSVSHFSFSALATNFPRFCLATFSGPTSFPLATEVKCHCVILITSTPVSGDYVLEPLQSFLLNLSRNVRDFIRFEPHFELWLRYATCRQLQSSYFESKRDLMAIADRHPCLFLW